MVLKILYDVSNIGVSFETYICMYIGKYVHRKLQLIRIIIEIALRANRLDILELEIDIHIRAGVVKSRRGL